MAIIVRAELRALPGKRDEFGELVTALAAAAAHNQHCVDLLARVPELAEMTTVDLHGDLGPDLAAWVEDNPVAHAHPPLR